MTNNYLKYLAYTLIALGGINLVYQNDKSNIEFTAGISIVSGVLLAALTLLPAFSKVIVRREIQAIFSVLAVLVIISQFINL